VFISKRTSLPSVLVQLISTLQLVGVAVRLVGLDADNVVSLTATPG